MLESLVLEVAVPQTHELTVASLELLRSVEAFVAAPSAPGLGEVRTTWKSALLAWKRAYTFRNGPIVSSNALLRVMYWPSKAGAIDALVAGSTSLSEAALDDLGADVKGLFAMEHLLYDEPALARFEGQGKERARTLLTSLARNVSGYAQAVKAELGDGKAFAKGFASTPQANLELLVNQMVDSIETVASQQLQGALELHQSKRLTQHTVEGGKSGMSSQIPAALLMATERLYLGEQGLGLGALTKAVSAPVHERAIAAFANARRTLEALGAPLEVAAGTNPAALDAAIRDAKALELAFKLDVTSTLGVTLTFSANDGD